MGFFTFYNSTEDLCSSNSISFLCIYSLQKPVEVIILHALPVSQLLFLMWYPRRCLIQVDPETLTGSGSPPIVNFLFIRVPLFPHERVQFLLRRRMVRQRRCGEVCYGSRRREVTLATNRVVQWESDRTRACVTRSDQEKQK